MFNLIDQVTSKIQEKIIPRLGRLEDQLVFKSVKNTFRYLNYVLLIMSMLAILQLLNEHFLHQPELGAGLSHLLLLLLNNFGWFFLGILCYLMFQERDEFQYYLASGISYLLFYDCGHDLIGSNQLATLLFALLALLTGGGLLVGYRFLLDQVKQVGQLPLGFWDHLLVMGYFTSVFGGGYYFLTLVPWQKIAAVLERLNIDHPLWVFLIVFLEMLLWYIGVNGYGILAPLVLLFAVSNLNTNFYALANGEAPQFIFTPNFWDYFLSVSGSGITGALVILSLCSQKSSLKALGLTAVKGAFFSISEPIVFGIPIVMNPYFFLPFVVGTPLLGVFQWFVFKQGWVAYPTYFVADLPLPLASFLATMDWRSLILTIITIGLATLMYWPFYHAFEKNYLEKNDQDHDQDLDLDF